jgi:hypothetical protein
MNEENLQPPVPVPAPATIAATTDYQWQCYWQAQDRIRNLSLEELKQAYLDLAVENGGTIELLKSNLMTNWALLEKAWTE